MGLFGDVKCGRCDRRYSALRGRCPYCGARRRTGKNDRGGGRGRLIAGLVLLAVIIIAVIVLIFMSLNSGRNRSRSRYKLADADRYS